ncbi:MULTISPECIES: hypothetical protein [unclassified Leifsonia]|uniref:hypothetical protein n=1 Tax=unclassified Leifsonia TaxID=2663824 RepID=UPI00037F348F|nr:MULTISPECIES: hypothetical protein [unclassified Leifsonia]
MDAEPAEDRAVIEERYRHYLDRCNEHRFGELDAFVAPDVHVNGVRVGIHVYGGGLAGGLIAEAWGDLDRWRLDAAPDAGEPTKTAS